MKTKTKLNNDKGVVVECLKQYCKNNDTTQLTVRELVDKVKKYYIDVPRLQEASAVSMNRLVYLYGLPHKVVRTRKSSHKDIQFLNNIARDKYIKASFVEVQKLLPGVFKDEDAYKQKLELYNIPYLKTTDVILASVGGFEKFKDMDVGEVLLKFEEYCKQNNYPTFPNNIAKKLCGDIRKKAQIEKSVKNTVNNESNIIELEAKPMVIEALNNEEHLDELKETQKQIQDMFKGVCEEKSMTEQATEDVDGILRRKYRLLECFAEKCYSTKDYIDILDTLIYLCENITTHIAKTINQYDIMNSYQNDLLHEVENTESELQQDTYLLCKLRYLRHIRRLKQYETEDLKTIKSFIDTINTHKLKLTKNKLKALQEKRGNAKFIPMVDIKMVPKYDWAEYGSWTDKKIHKHILTTPVPTEVSYRVTAEVSGSGFGPFAKWGECYNCKNEETALELAKQDLEKLKKEKKGALMYSKLYAYKIEN